MDYRYKAMYMPFSYMEMFRPTFEQVSVASSLQMHRIFPIFKKVQDQNGHITYDQTLKPPEYMEEALENFKEHSYDTEDKKGDNKSASMNDLHIVGQKTSSGALTATDNSRTLHENAEDETLCSSVGTTGTYEGEVFVEAPSRVQASLENSYKDPDAGFHVENPSKEENESSETNTQKDLTDEFEEAKDDSNKNDLSSNAEYRNLNTASPRHILGDMCSEDREIYGESAKASEFSYEKTNGITDNVGLQTPPVHPSLQKASIDIGDIEQDNKGLSSRKNLGNSEECHKKEKENVDEKTAMDSTDSLCDKTTEPEEVIVSKCEKEDVKVESEENIESEVIEEKEVNKEIPQSDHDVQPISELRRQKLAEASMVHLEDQNLESTDAVKDVEEKIVIEDEKINDKADTVPSKEDALQNENIFGENLENHNVEIIGDEYHLENVPMGGETPNANVTLEAEEVIIHEVDNSHLEKSTSELDKKINIEHNPREFIENEPSKDYQVADESLSTASVAHAPNGERLQIDVLDIDHPVENSGRMSEEHTLETSVASHTTEKDVALNEKLVTENLESTMGSQDCYLENLGAKVDETELEKIIYLVPEAHNFQATEGRGKSEEPKTTESPINNIERSVSESMGKTGSQKNNKVIDHSQNLSSSTVEEQCMGDDERKSMEKRIGKEKVTTVEAETKDDVLEGGAQGRKAKEVSETMAEEQIAEAFNVGYNVDMEIRKHEPNVLSDTMISEKESLQQRETTHSRNTSVDEVPKEEDPDKGKYDSLAAAQLIKKLSLDEVKESEKLHEISEVVHDEEIYYEKAPPLHDEEQYHEKVPDQDEMMTLIAKCDMPNGSKVQVREDLKEYDTGNGTNIEKPVKVSEDRQVGTVTDTELYNDESGNNDVDSLSAVEDSEQRKELGTSEAKTEEHANKTITEGNLDSEFNKDEAEDSTREAEKKYEIEKGPVTLVHEYQNTIDDLGEETEMSNRKNENSDENGGDLLISHKSDQETTEVGDQMHDDAINAASRIPTHDVGNNTDQIKREPEPENLEKTFKSLTGNQSHKTITDTEASDTLEDNKSIEKEIGSFSTSEASTEENIQEVIVTEEAAEKIYPTMDDDERQDKNTGATLEVLKEQTNKVRIEDNRSVGSNVYRDEATDQTKEGRSLHEEQIEVEKLDEDNDLNQGKESLEAPIDSKITPVETPIDKIPDCILQNDKWEDKLKNNPDVSEKIVMDEVSAPIEQDAEERDQTEKEKSYQQNGEAGISPEEAEAVPGADTEDPSYTPDGEKHVIPRTVVLKDETETARAKDEDHLNKNIGDISHIHALAVQYVHDRVQDNDEDAPSPACEEKIHLTTNSKDSIDIVDYKEETSPKLQLVAGLPEDKNQETASETEATEIMNIEKFNEMIPEIVDLNDDTITAKVKDEGNLNKNVGDDSQSHGLVVQAINDVDSDNHKEAPRFFSEELIHQITDNEENTGAGVRFKRTDPKKFDIISVSEPVYQSQEIPEIADLSDDTTIVKVKDEENLNEKNGDIPDNQVFIVETIPVTVREKQEEASTSVCEEQTHQTTNSEDSIEVDVWEEKTDTEKLEINTVSVPESQSQETASESEAINIHDSTDDNLNKKIMEITGVNDDPETAIKKLEENQEKNIGDISDSQGLVEEMIHDRVGKKHKEAPNSLCEEQIQQTSETKDNKESVVHKEETETKMLEVISAVPEDQSQHMAGETKITKIENTLDDDMFGKMVASLTTSQALNEVEREGPVQNVTLSEVGEIKDNPVLEEDQTYDREISKSSLKKIAENPEETINDGKTASSLNQNVVAKSWELESQEKPESISMYENRDKKVPKEEKISDRILEKTSSTEIEALARSAEVVSERQILEEDSEEGATIEEAASVSVHRDQSKEINVHDDKENETTCEEVEKSDFTTVAQNCQNFKTVAETDPIKIKLSHDEKNQITKFDANDDQSHDANSACKENTNIIHLSEEEENVNNKDEETRDQTLDNLLASSTLSDEAEAISLHGDQSNSTSKADDTGDKNLNQLVNSDLPSIELNLEGRSETEPTSIEISEKDIPEIADLSDDTTTVKVKDEENLNEKNGDIPDNQVFIVETIPITVREKDEEASTSVCQEQTHQTTNSKDNIEVDIWEEKTDTEKLEINTVSVPENQSQETASESEAINIHDTTDDNLNKKITEITGVNDDPETAIKKHEENLEKNISDISDSQGLVEEMIHERVAKKHKEDPNSLCEEQIQQTSETKDNKESVVHKEETETKMLEVISAVPEDQSQHMAGETKITKIENTLGDDTFGKMVASLTTSQDSNEVEREGPVQNVTLSEVGEIIDNPVLEEDQAFDREISRSSFKKIAESPEETINDGKTASSLKQNVVAKSWELESQEKPESISMYKNRDEKVPKEEEISDRILEKTSSTESEALARSAEVVSERQILEEGATIEEAASVGVHRDQSKETNVHDDKENGTTYVEVEKSDFTTVAQNFEIVAETEPIKIKLSHDEESQIMTFDANDDQSYDANSACKENTNIIHLIEVEENVNNKDEETTDQTLNNLLATSTLSNEAEAISLHGDQSDSTSKADDTGDKILNQADSDLTSIELNLEGRSETEPTSIEISEKDNHDIVVLNNETEAASSKDEETISKDVDHSPVVPALLEDTRQELDRKHEKTSHALEEHIHEGIIENNSINFDILKGENKSENLDGDSEPVLEEDKCKGATGAGIIENDTMGSVSQESSEEKRNKTASSTEGDEHIHEDRETSKSKGGTLLEESETIDGAASKSSMQTMEGDKLKELNGLMSEEKYRNFETNQEEGTPMKEGALGACQGIHSNMVFEEPAMVDEVESPEKQILDEEETVKHIDNEVKDSNFVSHNRFKTTAATRPIDVDDKRNCDPMGDALAEKEASVEKSIQKHVSIVVSEGHIPDVLEDGGIDERDILDNVNKEKQDVDVLEMKELKDEKQDEGSKAQPEQIVSETISVNERSKKEISEEKKTSERGLEKEKYGDLELENPVNVVPEGLQIGSTDVNKEKLEKEGTDYNLEECSQKYGDKSLGEETSKLEPANQSNEPVLALDNIEGAMPHEEMLESVNESEIVRNADETNEGNRSKTVDDLAVSNELVEQITNVQSSGSHLQMDKIEPGTFEKAEEQFKSISTEDEEKPEKNETIKVNSQNDAKDIRLERESNIMLDKVATAESSEKIENIIAEKDAFHALDACVRDEEAQEQLHNDEIEAEKNNEPELEPEATDTMENESPNDEVKELNCVPLEQNSLMMGLTKKIETVSSINEDDAKKNHDVSVTTTSTEDTVQEVGQKLAEVSDSMPRESAQEENSTTTVDVEFTKEKINDAEDQTEVEKSEYNSNNPASIHAIQSAHDITADGYVKGEEISEGTTNMLLTIERSGINTVNQGEKIGGVSNLISKEEVDERVIPSAEVTEDEERSSKLSITQETEVGPLAEEREMLAKTCEVDFDDKIKENEGQGSNDAAISKQGILCSSSVEQVTEDKVEHTMLENTSDFMLEEQSHDVKNIDDAEDKSSESNLCHSSPALVVGEAMIPEQAISDSLPAEQVKEETSISEDNAEGSIKLNTTDFVKERNLDAKDNTQNTVVKDDGSPRRNLNGSPPVLAVDKGVKDDVLQYDKATHDIIVDRKKATSTEESGPDSKVDIKEFNDPNLNQDERIHGTVLEKKMTESAIQKDNEGLNKDVDISSATKASQKNMLEKEGGEDGNVLLRDIEQIDKACHETSEEKTLPISESVNQTGKLIIEDPNRKEAFEIESEVQEAETKGENQDGKGEHQVQNLKRYSSEELKASNPCKVQQSILVPEPINETAQVAENFLEERSPPGLTDEKQTKDAADNQVGEEKTDEEKDEDEHKTEESGHDATVVVQSRDADSKSAHKKSHNILSGVGSKVKHSLAKVKKVITGKSSHSKTLSPK